MKIYREGEKSKGLCQVCKKQVPTTFRVSSVKRTSGKGRIEDVLAACCDHCDHVVAIPQQSSPRIKEMVSKKYSIEVRLPIHLRDILVLACSHLNLGAGEQLKDSLVRYYIALAGENRKLSKSIKKHSDSDFAKGSSYRLSLKINESIYQQFVNLMKETRLNKTQLLKGLILQINEDVLQNPTNKRIHELERLMLAAA